MRCNIVFRMTDLQSGHVHRCRGGEERGREGGDACSIVCPKFRIRRFLSQGLGLWYAQWPVVQGPELGFRVLGWWPLAFLIRRAK